MDKWYMIGNNSSFDGDMSFSEISVDYFNRGDYLDVAGYYHYYMGVAIKYYSEFVDLYNVEDIGTYLKEIRSKRFLDLSNIVMGDFEKRFKKFKAKNAIENISVEFKSLLNITSNAFNAGDYDSIHEHIGNIFLFLSYRLCFENDNKSVHLNKNKNFSFIANSTGWFSFNSYMFALVNGVYLLGVPSGFSIFDMRVNCSIVFLRHDVFHSDNIMKILSSDLERDKLRLVYETILKASDDRYNQQEKELLIFALWYLIHENYQSISSSGNYPSSFSMNVNEIMGYVDVFDDIDYKVQKDMLDNLDEIYGWIDTYLSKSGFFYISNISEDAKSSQSIKSYLEGLYNDDYNPENYRDRMARLAIMPIYGFYMLHKLFVELNVLD